MQPKFKIGDKVWLMANNRAIERTVRGYFLVNAGTLNNFFMYTVSEVGITHGQAKDLDWINGYFLHSSKTDLLISL